MLSVHRVAAFVLWLGVGVLAVRGAPQPTLRLHAHNDYLHSRPLLDALDNGFCSVEADIYLVDAELLVAHDRSKVQPGRTLQKLYLDPLRDRVRKYGGRVYPGGPEFTLLVELKDDWHTSYSALRKVLTSYAEILSTFSSDKKKTNAITVIITGHRSAEMFAGEQTRYAALDGDLPDLDSNPPPGLVPLISSYWYAAFKWRGVDAMPLTERTKLRQYVTRAHDQGRRIRFWGAPDQPVFWQELLAAGVDLINTDKLEDARKFIASGPPPPGGER